MKQTLGCFEHFFQELFDLGADPLDAALVVADLRADLGNGIALQAQFKNLPVPGAAEAAHGR